MRTHGTKVRREQTVELTNPWIIAILRFVLRNTRAGERLFPFDHNQYTQALKGAWSLLNVSNLGLTTYSPRPGAATDDLLQGVAFSTVQERGRWLHPQSCRIYLDRAQALALTTNAVAARFNRLAQDPKLIGDVFAFSPLPLPPLQL